MLTVIVIVGLVALAIWLTQRYQLQRNQGRLTSLAEERWQEDAPALLSPSARNAQRRVELQRLAQGRVDEEPGGSALSQAVGQHASETQRANAQSWLVELQRHEAGFAALDALVVDAAAELDRLGVPRRYAGGLHGWDLGEVALVVGGEGSEYVTAGRGALAPDAKYWRCVGAEIDVPDYDVHRLVPPRLEPYFPHTGGSRDNEGMGLSVGPEGQLVWGWQGGPYEKALAAAIVNLARREGITP